MRVATWNQMHSCSVFSYAPQQRTSTFTRAPSTDSVSVGLPGIRRSQSMMVPSFAPAGQRLLVDQH